MKFTEYLTGTVKSTDEWKVVHASCLAEGETFTTEPFNHSSGTWYWLVCPCSAKHLCDLAAERQARATH